MKEIPIFKNFKTIFSLLLVIFVIELISIFTLLAKNIIFFICFFTILILALCFNLINHKSEAILRRKDLLNIIFILLIGLSVKLFFIFRYEGLFIDIDTWFDRLVVENILYTDHYYDYLGWEFYDHAGCAPHLFIVFLSEITGIQPYFLIRYIIPLTIIIFPIMYYLLFSKLLNNSQIAGLAIILYILSSEFIWVNLRGEFLIAPLVILAIYFFISYIKSKKLIFFVFLPIILFVANFAHITHYCIILIPALTTVSIYYFLKKEFNLSKLLILLAFLVTIPLIYYGLFPNTSIRDYTTFVSIVNNFIDLSFILDYGFLVVLIACSFMVIFFSAFTIVIHVIFSLLQKYFDSFHKKIILIVGLFGLVLGGIYLSTVLGYFDFFSTSSYQYILGIYSNLLVFFLFYSYLILLIVLGFITFVKNFGLNEYKNWTLVSILILLLIVFTTSFQTGFAPIHALDFTVAVRIIFFIVFPLCILVSKWVFSSLKDITKIYAGLLMVLICFTGFFSLAKATIDGDYLQNETLISNIEEEIALEYFYKNLTEPTVIWMDYKYRTMLEAFTPFKQYLLIETKLSLSPLLVQYTENPSFILDYYNTKHAVNNSYIFIPSYSDFGNLTTNLLNISVIFYQNPKVMILLY